MNPRTSNLVLYQLFPRLFGNRVPDPVPHGTRTRNGCGTFADIDDPTLASLRDLGCTHLWLLGVLRHATGTPHPGLPADDPDLLKGVAGSPFAVRDLFDVCPDLATDPDRRLQEFQSLVQRAHRHDLRILIDFVPNHVARSHHSVVRPDLEPGLHDDRSRFFARDNHFFHLPGQGPLRLPTVHDGRPATAACIALGGCDGAFAPEAAQARVTGNNVASAAPGPHDWFETVKLNYGHDFTRGPHGAEELALAGTPGHPVPATWTLMDAVLAHWQATGIDGFRCDMAHWIPVPFWKWAIARARQRQPDTVFLAEAYDDDPNKLTAGNVLHQLVDAGFDAVYDHAAYRILKDLYDGPKWANDLDHALAHGAPLHHALRYAENHDEIRLAHPAHWGGRGTLVGPAVSAILYGVSRGPILLHNGQEVGEAALESDGRTSIFEYGRMPALQAWRESQQPDGPPAPAASVRLRAAYRRLLQALAHPAFGKGEFLPLNPHNLWNPRFGRLPGETASGHWLYAWLRHVPGTRHAVVGVANLHPSHPFEAIRIELPDEARALLTPALASSEAWTDLLVSDANLLQARSNTGALLIDRLPPATTAYLIPPAG